MSNGSQIIVDSDAFVGLMWERDDLHQRAKKTFYELRTQKVQLTTTSSVVLETATVLSHRSGQKLAKQFLDDFIGAGEFPVIFISEPMQNEGLDLFRAQSKKGSSVTDCINAAVCKRLNLSQIYSFDKVYPKAFGIKLIDTPESNE